jgi:hypothetical protein
MGRERAIRVMLSDDELAQLDELRPPGMPRAVFIRSLIHRPPEVKDVASKEEALAILTSLARDGKVSAAIALARELRGDAGGAGRDDLLDSLMRGDT